MKHVKVAIIFLLCVITLLCTGCTDAKKEKENKTMTSDTEVSPEGENEDEQVQIPDFEMTLLEGGTVSFESYRGKKVLLNFWATWCGPCVGEMPAFQKLSEEYPDELVILAVNCSEERDAVQKFIKNNEYTFPIVLDTDGAIQEMFGGITSIPVTVIIDEEGYIVSSTTGATDADTMYEEYKKELGF